MPASKKRVTIMSEPRDHGTYSHGKGANFIEPYSLHPPTQFRFRFRRSNGNRFVSPRRILPITRVVTYPHRISTTTERIFSSPAKGVSSSIIILYCTLPLAGDCQREGNRDHTQDPREFVSDHLTSSKRTPPMKEIFRIGGPAGNHDSVTASARSQNA